MNLDVVDPKGRKLREITVADEVFGIEPNPSVVHQAYITLMGNRRAGGASTKSRGEVAGSTVKVRRQKGLGRARMGSIRSSARVGGGVAHGPKPHSFVKKLPKQMRRLAIRSALSSHAASGTLTVVEGLIPAEAKTSAVRASLEALGAGRAALIVSGEPEPNLGLAARNIAYAKFLPANNLNVVDLVNAHRLLMTEDAVRKAESLWGGDNLKPARGRRAEASNAV
jgi:large subunit ribosomal protein L4